MKLQKIMSGGFAVVLAIAVFIICAGCTRSDKGGQSTGRSARGKITVTVYDRGNVPASEGTIENNRWTRWINENGPVDVTFVAIPRVSPQQRLNTLFASGTAPDLIFEYAPHIKTPFYQQGMLMPLDDMIEKYGTSYKEFLNQNPGARKAGTMPDGKLYQFGKTNESGYLRLIYIRTDWLEKLNLKVPATIEELYQVARAFTENDPDGNGIRDTYGIGLSNYANSNGTVDQMFQAFNHHAVRGDDYVHAWAQWQARYEFTKRLYDEGIVDRDFLGDINGAKVIQDFVNGKVGILPWMGSILSFTTMQYATLKQNVPGAKLGVIPAPATSFGRFNLSMFNPMQMTAVVNADCKNPEAVMKYVDFISGTEAYMALTFGIEGEHYRMEDGVPVIIDRDKYNREVAWASDGFTMLVPYSVKEPFLSKTAGFNLDVPLEREGYELHKQALRIYLDTGVPFVDPTHSEHLPQPPRELQIISANLNTREFFVRAVVSGSTYTVDQAVKDARAAWERGGGNQIDAWYSNWYRNERQNSFLAADIYEIIRQQGVLSRLR